MLEIAENPVVPRVLTCFFAKNTCELLCIFDIKLSKHWYTNNENVGQGVATDEEKNLSHHDGNFLYLASSRM